ncbi:MAG: prephenate dehydrogenase [Oscillospiraceae bacterium]|nr:prephenate dehydrogenase [Oscillospiraceae bacterium]
MNTIGIVGLGLIGGSFAKAYHEAGWQVLACERDASVLSFAQISGAVNGVLDEKNIASCDLVLVCIYPEAAINFVQTMAPHIGSKPIVLDCCGTKRVVCDALFPVAKQHGFTYVGAHPMAGNHNSGFSYAKATLFKNAPVVIVPPTFDNIELLQKIKQLLAPAGFSRISVTTALEHDEMIAFTSQLAHVVSNAYIKSPTATRHKGFSAGSYKDMTRVAWLNPQMWAELFLENKDCLMRELDILSRHLAQYREALESDDMPRLIQLLDDGRRIKEEVDGR